MSRVIDSGPESSVRLPLAALWNDDHGLLGSEDMGRLSEESEDLTEPVQRMGMESSSFLLEVV